MTRGSILITSRKKNVEKNNMVQLQNFASVEGTKDESNLFFCDRSFSIKCDNSLSKSSIVNDVNQHPNLNRVQFWRWCNEGRSYQMNWTPKWSMTKFRQQRRKQVRQSWLRKSVPSFGWEKQEAYKSLVIFALCLVSHGPIGKNETNIKQERRKPACQSWRRKSVTNVQSDTASVPKNNSSPNKITVTIRSTW